MVFERADGSFGGGAAVKAGRHELIVDGLRSHVGFEDVRHLIV
jgi:hypothetical protein